MRQADRRARTTQRLLDAAAEVFARRGFHAATLDEVAKAAGRTKGAVYSNFAGKNGLFLALLDRHLDDQLAQVEQLAATRSSVELQASLEAAAAEQMTSGGAFGLLMLEFWLYAARDAEARAALAERYRRMRDRLASVIAAHDADAPRSADDAATLVLALDAGLFLQQVIDPGSVTPELRATAIAELVSGRATSH